MATYYVSIIHPWKMKFTPRSKFHHSPQVKNHCSRPRLAKIGLATPSLGVETVKCFVNVHLHCNVSKLKKISKFSSLPPGRIAAYNHIKIG